MTDREILSYSDQLREYVIDCRRQIHRMAEVGGKEVLTSAFIRAELKQDGILCEEVGETGLLGILDSGKPGAHIALRADIDALPILENANNLAGPRSCVSDNPATCHACGH